MSGEQRSFCISERKVGRLGEVTFYERVMRTQRRRGDIDRGDHAIYFGLRDGGALRGPRIDGYVLRLALDGEAVYVDALARAVAHFYRDRPGGF